MMLMLGRSLRMYLPVAFIASVLSFSYQSFLTYGTVPATAGARALQQQVGRCVCAV